MSSLQEIKVNVDQVSPTILSEGIKDYAAQTKLGQIFTADWKQRLLLAGKLWRCSCGTVTGAAGITGITGGGAGTTIDADEPEIAISVPTGYFLIPIEVHVSGILDQDANAELGAILVTMDRTQEPAGVTSATTPTLYNMLDGGGSFPGHAYGEVTVVTTDPTNEEILACEHVSSSEFVSNGAATNLTNGIVTRLQLHYEPLVPSIVAGACTLCVYWGGTAAVTAFATVVVGCVPSTWFPVS